MSVYIIRIEKTEVIIKEVECETIDQLTDTSNSLVRSLKAENPKAEYYVQVSKKNVGPSWMNKMPNDIKETVSGDVVVAVEASLLERAIIQRTHTKKLTDAQREKLHSEVRYIPADPTGLPAQNLPSPVELYYKNMLFKKFADEKIIAMVSHGAPNSKVVSALCAYENPQGWLAYSERHFPTPELVEPKPHYDGANIGFSPSIKRVENA